MSLEHLCKVSFGKAKWIGGIRKVFHKKPLFVATQLILETSCIINKLRICQMKNLLCVRVFSKMVQILHI